MHRQSERGQIVVLFAGFLVALVAMAGLVLDGGGAFAQRRAEQNAADLAALAGGTVQLNNGSDTAVIAAAKAIAKTNGYEDGKNAVVLVDPTVRGKVKVDITADHVNYFAGIFGATTWPVSVTATAEWGVPTGATGSAPIIFSIDAFDPSTGLPYSNYGCATATCSSFDFTKTQGSGSDAPLDAVNMAWTNLAASANVSTKDVKDILDGSAPIVANLRLNQYIGQHNNGVHNALFDTSAPNQPSVNTVLAGQDVVVPIVGAPLAPAATCIDGSGASTTYTNGCFRGWALFHITSASKNGSGEDGRVTGYFKTGFIRVGSTTLCTAGPSCADYHGLFVLRLSN